MEQNNIQKTIIKIVFLGDQQVGKSSIIKRFLENVFDEKYHPTIGVEFGSKAMNIQDRQLKLQLWYHKLLVQKGILLAMNNLDKLLLVTLEILHVQSSYLMLLMKNHFKMQIDGTKISNHKEGKKHQLFWWPIKLIWKTTGTYFQLIFRVISSYNIQKKAQDLDMMLVEVSAKNGQGVSEIFQQISQNLYQKKSGVIKNE